MSAALRCLACAALLASALAPAAARAEEFDAGDLVVHYTALSTLELTPAIADLYGIARSPSRALLNVAVVRKVAGAAGVPMAAQVEVFASDLQGRVRPVAMRRVDEPPAIYYLGELTVADGDRITFELRVTPEGRTSPLRLRLQQQFFTR